jgi:2-oxoisovalerate dehydrogenase E1 component
VQKTNKVIVAYEDACSWGYGAEIAARMADQLFPWLDAPVKRVASADTFVGYAPDLEDYILPQVEDLAQAMRELHAF